MAVAVAGGIGFVGLVVPHVARLLVGAAHRRVLAVAVPLGGLFLLTADLVARTAQAPVELPVGIVTTLIKGDVFNWGQIMTGALLGAAPPLIIYAFLMDYYIAGLTAGATKG